MAQEGLVIGQQGVPVLGRQLGESGEGLDRHGEQSGAGRSRKKPAVEKLPTPLVQSG